MSSPCTLGTRDCPAFSTHRVSDERERERGGGRELVDEQVVLGPVLPRTHVVPRRTFSELKSSCGLSVRMVSV